MMTVGYRLLIPLLASGALVAQQLAPLPRPSSEPNSLRIVAPCVPAVPWTVAGEYGALLGRGNGKFEAWQWPVKILSNFAIRAELSGYPVPIDVNALAAQIEVTPAETVITYAHAAFTVRQHMFAPRGSARPSAAAVVFFEIDSIRPLDLTFSFTPEMLRMWPAPNFGRPNGEWLAEGASGLYLLHTDNPKLSAVIAMPRSRPGIQVPYQEHPQTYPLELKLSFDPQRDRGLVFPLTMALLGDDQPSAQASASNSSVPVLYSATQSYYHHFFDHRLTITTPDKHLDEALLWAELAIDQMQVRYRNETGMVAGYYESADSARPGYAWFFGRDTLWTTFAINSYGDFALTRRALDFLIHRQRADGKMMHEFSQSADALDWNSTPYFYASADACPLFVMAMWDYVEFSGDIGYLKNNWEAVRKAYAFTRAHESSDGIYNNSQGSGWVESWPQGMPQQEIYLAALDRQSAAAMSHLAQLAGDAALSATAKQKAVALSRTIQTEYGNPSTHFYAFSRDDKGSVAALDDTASIYPAVAWWQRTLDGSFGLDHAGPMLARWASHEFSTDWGARDISEQTSFYDPISYHQGSVWPLFTGWVSLAEYRAGRPLAGYASLMQNANLTWMQDLGSVTELLSGQFFQPLGRSSSHQMWSSAMVIAPLTRGLFGLEQDAIENTLHVSPQLPAEWQKAELHGVPLGSATVDLVMERKGATLAVRATTKTGQPFCLVSASTRDSACGSSSVPVHTLFLPLPAVELSIPSALPEPGSVTHQLKVLSQEASEHKLVFTLEAPGGSNFDLPIRNNRGRVSVTGGELNGNTLHIAFPAGVGYQTQSVTFSW